MWATRACFVLVAANLAALSCSAPSPRSSQSIVLITVDTLRYDALGFNGNASAETPSLDQLAEASLVFDQARSHNVVTLPAHASLLTGLLPPQHGVRENSGFVLSESIPTLAEAFRAEGFATAAFVSAFPLDHRSGLDRGFDVYDDRYSSGPRDDDFRVGERPGGETVTLALQWWQENAGRRRFLWVHLYEPHAPYQPPEPWLTRFAGDPYLGEVAAADSYLGELLTALEPNTTVVLTSDHGEALGDHGEQSHGLFAYEATLHIPLLIRSPSIAPGRNQQNVGLIDLAPTLLAVAGLEAARDLPGQDLLETTAGDGRPQYFEALSTYFNRGWAPLRGVVADGWKFIDLPIPELYSLRHDPTESNNLAAQETAVHRRLERLLPRESPWPPESGDDVEVEDAGVLRALGYLARSGDAPGREALTSDNDPKNLIHLDGQIQQTMAALAARQYEQAATRARQVIAERPEMAVGHEYLALALRGLEDVAGAERAAHRGLSYAPGDDTLARLRGELLTEQGRFNEARELLRALDQRAPDRQNKILLGNLEFMARRLAAARDWYQKTLREDPDNPRALEGLGAVCLEEGDVAQAAGYFRRAVDADPHRAIAWNGLGVVAARNGDAAAAIDAWSRAIESDPGHLDALFNLGLVAARAGRVAEAARALERFVAIAPPQYERDIHQARQILAGLR